MPVACRRRFPGGGASFALALVLAVGAVAPARAQSDWQLSGIDRVVAVSDIHGAYDAFVRILSRAGLIDGSGAWSGGDSHLVVDGDVLDRGPESRRALDLIMRLEAEAESAGGGVHFVLGNHEVMNLTGDLRYVSAAEFAAFAPDESSDMREAAFARYRERQTAGGAAKDAAGDAATDGAVGAATDAETVADAALRARFDESFPPGFFAQRRAFSPDGIYGAWLLEKPLLLVVDGVAFVHGGLAAQALAYGKEANAQLGRQLLDYVQSMAILIDAGLLDPTDDFYDQAPRLQAAGAGTAGGLGGAAENVRAAAAKLLDLQTADLFLPDSPIWYRGNVSCNRLTEQDRFDAALAAIGAERLVVGHTPTPNAFVLSRMDESLLRIDTGMLNNYYGGRASALLIEPGRLAALYEDETGASAPLPQPRRVGNRPAGWSAEDLEAMLRRATVTATADYDATATLVQLRDGEREFEGLFMPGDGSNVLPAVAAYRLDRLLGLDMVPVTVAREIDGMPGALQFLPVATVSERERSTRGLGGSAWCPLGDQLRDMYVFDILTYNEGRTVDRIRYSTNSFDVLLVGNDRAFSSARGRPSYLAETKLSLTPVWRSALEALDADSLEEALGGVLDRRRIRALLARRDALLASVP